MIPDANLPKCVIASVEDGGRTVTLRRFDHRHAPWHEKGWRLFTVSVETQGQISGQWLTEDRPYARAVYRREAGTLT